MLDRFLRFISENRLIEGDKTVVAAVSGGADSVLMCLLLSEAKIRFVIAHCNFGLRGEESDGDEDFVKEFAKSLGVKFFSKRFDTVQATQEKKVSVQMAARELRYEWFESLCLENNLDLVATAHHQNDVLETLLLNLVRGTGIAGLHGIKPRNGHIIRPVLFLKKNEIITALQEKRLNWREDSSNESSKYHRNLLRNEVIPLLRKINPELEQTIQQTIEKLALTEEVYQQALIEFKQSPHVSFTEDGVTIDIKALTKEKGALIKLFEIITEYGFNYSQAKEIFQSIKGQPGKLFYSSTHVLVKDRNLLIMEKMEKRREKEILIEQGQGEFFLKGLKLKFEQLKQPATILPDKNLAFVDEEKLTFPLTVRRWQDRDFFYPLGMKGKKKVSDFLINEKVTRLEKESVLVLLSQTEVVWIIGYRLDERFKVTENTHQIVKIQAIQWADG